MIKICADLFPRHFTLCVFSKYLSPVIGDHNSRHDKWPRVLIARTLLYLEKYEVMREIAIIRAVYEARHRKSKT